MSVAIQLLNAPFAVQPTGEASVWVWVFYNQVDWQPKATVGLATKFSTADVAQTMIDKFKLDQFNARIVQL